MKSQQLFWLFLGIFTVFSMVSVSEATLIRSKRQWGFGYPLFGGPGNSWEVPTNLPTYWGHNAWAGR